MAINQRRYQLAWLRDRFVSIRCKQILEASLITRLLVNSLGIATARVTRISFLPLSTMNVRYITSDITFCQVKTYLISEPANKSTIYGF